MQDLNPTFDSEKYSNNSSLTIGLESFLVRIVLMSILVTLQTYLVFHLVIKWGLQKNKIMNLERGTNKGNEYRRKIKLLYTYYY